MARGRVVAGGFGGRFGAPTAESEGDDDEAPPPAECSECSSPGDAFAAAAFADAATSSEKTSSSSSSSSERSTKTPKSSTVFDPREYVRRSPPPPPNASPPGRWYAPRFAARASAPDANDARRLGGAFARQSRFGTDAAAGMAGPLMSGFYNFEDFLDGTKYYEAELPRPPEPAHVKPDGSITDRFKWQYHYLQTFFGSGTHYILLDNPYDAPDLSQVAPYGYVVANGQAMMFDRLKSRIRSGENVVMLHNTGGVTQAFASLRKAMVSANPPPPPNVLLDKLANKEVTTLMCLVRYSGARGRGCTQGRERLYCPHRQPNLAPVAAPLCGFRC